MIYNNSNKNKTNFDNKLSINLDKQKIKKKDKIIYNFENVKITNLESLNNENTNVFNNNTNEELFLKSKKASFFYSEPNLLYYEKIIDASSVTQVIKGGKKMTYRIATVVGIPGLKIGVGIGKSEDKDIAYQKSILKAIKSSSNIYLTQSFSIPYSIKYKYGSSLVLLKPSKAGSGILAGTSVKTVLECAGYENISAKQLGSKNPINNAKATINCLNEIYKKINVEQNKSCNKRKFYTKLIVDLFDDNSTYTKTLI